MTRPNNKVWSLTSDAVRTNYMTMTPGDRLVAATTMPLAEALAFIEALLVREVGA